jgi:hypothetical protein
MSGTNFWFDRNGDCKDPAQAIAWLQDARSRTYLSDYYTGFAIPQSIDLQNQALLMMGTTGHLQAALLRDYNNGNGIRAVQTAGAGSMKIWYVRRRAGTETKSVVIIASEPLYWGSQARTGWKDMYPSSYINAMSLNSLASQVLPTGSGKAAEW